jgi:hypothetical protein
MKIQRHILSILSTMFVAGMLLVLPVQAQQSPAQQPSAQQTPDTAQPQVQPVPATTDPATNQAAPSQQQPANQQPAKPGSTVNPSQGPLQPVQPVTSYPDAAGEQQAQPSTSPSQSNIPNGPQPKRPTEPVGAATAESVPTTGGAAAKPAGVAIAPAKQHQTRSLLIKVGAALAAGAALGTVYALSHGTASTPPGSGLAGVTQK